MKATAIAHPNIAFIKYWGNRDSELRLAINGSISMNLDGLFTKTEVVFSEKAKYDTLVLNHRKIEGPGLQRVSKLLDLVRTLAKRDLYAAVTSENNFPTGAGIASSASAFAALAVASSAALELDLDEVQLSRLARRGSGSACRSIPSGFVEWHAGETDEDSYAVSLAASNHWEIDDCIAIVAAGHKPTGSTEGHALAGTSPLQAARVADTPRRLE
ncbi:MAG: diphosphomevalonate decarboxylase, partial [Anaerolineaceae bacterium]|nr:diphosphomevalonate decarboxylase [Anaerolineaceae bacterium]